MANKLSTYPHEFKYRDQQYTGHCVNADQQTDKESHHVGCGGFFNNREPRYISGMTAHLLIKQILPYLFI